MTSAICPRPNVICASSGGEVIFSTPDFCPQPHGPQALAIARRDLTEARQPKGVRARHDRPTAHRGYYSRVTPKGELNLGAAAAVVAPTAAVADALCKCALLCEPTLLEPMLEAHRARLLYAETPRA